MRLIIFYFDNIGYIIFVYLKLRKSGIPPTLNEDSTTTFSHELSSALAFSKEMDAHCQIRRDQWRIIHFLEFTTLQPHESISGKV